MSYQPERTPSGRDPLQPFGRRQAPAAAPEPPSAPTGSGKLWWLFGGAIVLIALVLFVPGQLNPTRPTSTPTVATTKPVAPITPQTTANATNGIPFETKSAKGYWQIDSSSWGTDGLSVVMTIRVDEGSLDFDFFSFDDTASETIDAYYPATGALRPRTLRAGQSASGIVQFDVKKGPTTVVLTNAQGRQITALMVKP